MKQTISRLLIVLLIAVLLTACGGQANTDTDTDQGVTAPQPTAAVVVPEGISISKSIVLDPALATDQDSLTVISYLYEGLVRVENSEVAPALASSWTVSDDGLDYIFNLRPGLKFQDGSEVNADAVITNFNRWFDPDNSLHGSGTYDAWVANFKGFKGASTFDGIEKVDNLTVLLHLNQPDKDFLSKLTNPAFSIVSPAALAAAGFGTSTGVAGGTGPFTLGEWGASSLTLQPNSAYWNSSAIPGKAVTITLK